MSPTFSSSGLPHHPLLHPGVKLRTRPGAFTLIELLVVITIMVILIALLLPSLRSARDLALFTKCSALIRGYAFATNCYTNDNKEYFPINQYSQPWTAQPVGDGTPTAYYSAWQFHTIATYMVPVSGKPSTIDGQWYQKYICPAENVPVTNTAAIRFSIGCAISIADDPNSAHYGLDLSGFRTSDLGLLTNYSAPTWSYITDPVIHHYTPSQTATWFDGMWDQAPSGFFTGFNYYKQLYGPSHFLNSAYQYNVALADGSVTKRSSNWKNNVVYPEDLQYKIWF